MTHHALNPAFARWKGLLLDYAYARRFTDDLAQKFSVLMPSKYAEFKSLSGGNQQKVILGRELLLTSPFLLLDQPTRGLDVGSIEYVHDQILRMRKEGRAVLMISADLEEIFLLADRIAVLYRGELVADVPAEQASLHGIGALMLQGREAAA
jgi:simple sugar transport system ATP-binding protein